MAHITLTGARVDFSFADRFAAVAQRFNEWRAYRRAVAELAALTDRELADIGVCRYDIPAVARGDYNGLAR